jgi:hypothetical protein
MKKSIAEIFVFSFLIKNCYLLIPSAPKRKHPVLQKMKFILTFFLFLGNFALLDPDLDRESGSGYGYGYGSRDNIEYGFNSDPDPQH